MIIKVCGMRDSDNIRAVEQLGVDWIGMIFWPQSPRFVRMIPTGAGIIPDRASADTAPTGKGTRRVGVFVDASTQDIITRIVNYNLDLVQLHGNETPTFIRNLRATVSPEIRPDIRIIKAISVDCGEDIDRYRDYEDCVDYFLFDTRCTAMGGSGRQFDWTVLDRYKGSKPFLLSGGIGPDDAAAVKGIAHPMFAGIDLNSRFETSPGVKDIPALRQFINNIRKA